MCLRWIMLFKHKSIKFWRLTFVEGDHATTAWGGTDSPAHSHPLWLVLICIAGATEQPISFATSERGVDSRSDSYSTSLYSHKMQLTNTLYFLLKRLCIFGPKGAIQIRYYYYYGRPLSVSGRPCYILPMFIFFFYGRLILRPWLTEVRESFTRGGPWVALEKLLLGFFPGHP